MNRAIRSGMGLALLLAAWCPVALAEGGWRLELSGGTFDDRAGIGPDSVFEPFVSGSSLELGAKVAKGEMKWG